MTQPSQFSPAAISQLAAGVTQDSNIPSNIRWLRQGDGAVVAEIQSFVPAFNPGGGASQAQLNLQAGPLPESGSQSAVNVEAISADGQTTGLFVQAGAGGTTSEIQMQVPGAGSAVLLDSLGRSSFVRGGNIENLTLIHGLTTCTFPGANAQSSISTINFPGATSIPFAIGTADFGPATSHSGAFVQTRNNGDGTISFVCMDPFGNPAAGTVMSVSYLVAVLF